MNSRAIDSFWFYDKKQNKKTEETADNKQEMETKAPVKRKAETSSEAPEQKSRRRKSSECDLEIEIPATQSPPKSNRKSETSENESHKSSIPEYLPAGKFCHKSLSRVKDQDRGNRSVSMLSSPSIMLSSKPKPTTPSSSTLSESFMAELKSKVQENKTKISEKFDVDGVFDKLKKSDEDEEKKVQEPQVNKIEPLGERSPDKPKKVKTPEVPLDLSPIKKFHPNPEWSSSGIDAAALKHLKENSVNFRAILEEMKKVNEKILEFRRGLAFNDG